jgi:hypothetical protein
VQASKGALFEPFYFLKTKIEITSGIGARPSRHIKPVPAPGILGDLGAALKAA